MSKGSGPGAVSGPAGVLADPGGDGDRIAAGGLGERAGMACVDGVGCRGGAGGGGVEGSGGGDGKGGGGELQVHTSSVTPSWVLVVCVHPAATLQCVKHPSRCHSRCNRYVYKCCHTHSGRTSNLPSFTEHRHMMQLLCYKCCTAAVLRCCSFKDLCIRHITQPQCVAIQSYHAQTSALHQDGGFHLQSLLCMSHTVCVRVKAVIRVFSSDYLLGMGCCVPAEAADAKQAQVATEPGGPVVSQSVIRLCSLCPTEAR